eukprot:6249869-Alexandrium_andersonii.AAC.1
MARYRICEFNSPSRIEKHFKQHMLSTLWHVASRVLSERKGPEERSGALRCRARHSGSVSRPSRGTALAC